ncbi:MAG: TraR/DksA C4-type zinc finger protein [Deltaproteobacteria bacterium]|nr:TraR/DksA C4-type zinc finger protein [Deltaproteobacteria bacterium]MBW1911228.1 TraR/DksA C4-type zinc finger protein [Deltaproteobacteria bacterium]
MSPELIQKTIDFHGHSCPGLAIGIRAAEVALREVGRSSDENVVAVVENDNCAVDAIQFLLSCTYGKGNLVHLDYGKLAFSFYRRSDGKAIRVVGKPEIFGHQDDEFMNLRKKTMSQDLNGEEKEQLKRATAARTRRIMEADLDELFEITPAQVPVPRKARILEGLTCDACGERTMESRTRRFLGQTLCIPCFEAREKKI